MMRLPDSNKQSDRLTTFDNGRDHTMFQANWTISFKFNYENTQNLTCRQVRYNTSFKLSNLAGTFYTTQRNVVLHFHICDCLCDFFTFSFGKILERIHERVHRDLFVRTRSFIFVWMLPGQKRLSMLVVPPVYVISMLQSIHFTVLSSAECLKYCHGLDLAGGVLA